MSISLRFSPGSRNLGLAQEKATSGIGISCAACVAFAWTRTDLHPQTQSGEPVLGVGISLFKSLVECQLLQPVCMHDVDRILTKPPVTKCWGQWVRYGLCWVPLRYKESPNVLRWCWVGSIPPTLSNRLKVQFEDSVLYQWLVYLHAVSKKLSELPAMWTGSFT